MLTLRLKGPEFSLRVSQVVRRAAARVPGEGPFGRRSGGGAPPQTAQEARTGAGVRFVRHGEALLQERAQPAGAPVQTARGGVRGGGQQEGRAAGGTSSSDLLFRDFPRFLLAVCAQFDSPSPVFVLSRSSPHRPRKFVGMTLPLPDLCLQVPIF